MSGDGVRISARTLSLPGENAGPEAESSGSTLVDSPHPDRMLAVRERYGLGAPQDRPRPISAGDLGLTVVPAEVESPLLALVPPAPETASSGESPWQPIPDRLALLETVRLLSLREGTPTLRQRAEALALTDRRVPFELRYGRNPKLREAMDELRGAMDQLRQLAGDNPWSEAKDAGGAAQTEVLRGLADGIWGPAMHRQPAEIVRVASAALSAPRNRPLGSEEQLACLRLADRLFDAGNGLSEPEFRKTLGQVIEALQAAGDAGQLDGFDAASLSRFLLAGENPLVSPFDRRQRAVVERSLLILARGQEPWEALTPDQDAALSHARRILGRAEEELTWQGDDLAKFGKVMQFLHGKKKDLRLKDEERAVLWACLGEMEHLGLGLSPQEQDQLRQALSIFDQNAECAQILYAAHTVLRELGKSPRTEQLGAALVRAADELHARSGVEVPG